MICKPYISFPVRRIIKLILVGPPAGYLSGSLLRPLNIWYTLRGLKSIQVLYLPVKSIIDLLPKLYTLLIADIVIISGVNPWVSAMISLMRRLTNKITIVDVHGSAWYECSIGRYCGLLSKKFLFISELMAYRFATLIVVASRGLERVLKIFFKINNVYIIPNAITPLFEKIVARLSIHDKELLKRYILTRINRISFTPTHFLFLAPLPKIFQSNVLAYNALRELARNLKKAIIVVTGIEGKPMDKVGDTLIVHTGYLTYPEYVALLIASDAIILPYPDNAICGGARNKVLEAGYCKKPVISTRVGMLYIQAIPSVHYISIDTMLREDIQLDKLESSASELYKVVSSMHSFTSFKASFLKLLRCIM